MIADSIPHPSLRLPVLGDALKVSPDTRIQDTMGLARELGSIFEVRVRNAQFVVVSDPDLVAELCDDKRFTKKVAGGVAEMRAVLADGLFTAHTDEPNWRIAHEVLLPAFSQAAMRSYHATMVDVCNELLGSFDRGLGEPVEVLQNLTKYTLETVSRCGFGYKLGAFSDDSSDPAVAGLLNIVNRALHPPFSLPFLGRRQAKVRAEGNARDIAHLRGVVDGLIQRRVNGENEGSDDLLESMLNSKDSAGQMLDHTNVRNQVMTFIFAGYVTTASALGVTLYYLSANPDVLKKARAEVDAMWPAGDGVPSFEQIAKLRYLRRVFDESLRLWPTAPAFTRQAREDTVLGGKYPMRRGEAVTVHIPLLHRTAAWGDDVERFDPDRFLAENVKKRPAHVYKPFGTGERACIGRQFANHEALVALAFILRRYELVGDPGYKLQISESLSLKPKKFHLSLSLREHRGTHHSGEFDDGAVASGCPHLENS
ncbi:cytochrome P450 [Nocardia sp. NPDC059091]|uniref:cytochrome P450 n=1 Tax=unclassified Nocardia TaxID=2637762 RepID=UPI0036B9C294